MDSGHQKQHNFLFCSNLCYLNTNPGEQSARIIPIDLNDSADLLDHDVLKYFAGENLPDAIQQHKASPGFVHGSEEHSSPCKPRPTAAPHCSHVCQIGVIPLFLPAAGKNSMSNHGPLVHPRPAALLHNTRTKSGRLLEGVRSWQSFCPGCCHQFGSPVGLNCRI